MGLTAGCFLDFEFEGELKLPRRIAWRCRGLEVIVCVISIGFYQAERVCLGLDAVQFFDRSIRARFCFCDLIS